MREYFKTYILLEKLEEMNKFLDAHDLPKLSQEDINHLSTSKTSNKVEVVIKSLPIKTRQELDGFTAEFYHVLKEKLTPVLLKLFQKIEWEGMLPNLFCEITTTLIPKPD
jgi:hypothetical protein